jgi:tetratricopeptide (TPR) repeat protein/predicted regulator of Ras-like GTPase activity (Roadblock/LC7/MglB family)
MGLFSRTLSRLEELKKALTRDPASRQFLALADEYRKQGQTREAIGVLERGLAQDPSAVAGHVALGRLFQQGGRLEEALASFHAALKLDPQNLVALRQTADVHLSRGDAVEAIKKLKLFRGLSPGDREVNELIRQLEGELAAAAAPRLPLRPEREAPPPPPPAPEFRTGGVPVQRARPAAMPAVATDVAAPTLPAVPPLPAVLEAIDVEPLPASELPDWLEAPQERPVPSEAPPPLSAPATVPAGFGSGEPSLAESAEPGSEFGDSSASGPESSSVPVVTEMLATLLRAQGHLGEAHVAYQELARTEADPDRARRLLDVAEEISAVRAGTVRGRLEAWVEPFSRSLGRRDADLSAAVEEVVERLGPSAAVVTDFEGVPVVDAGPRSEAEAMENLSAELTAFWKNVRRSRTEIGEGALDSFVLSGSAGLVAVKAITPAYALLLKAGPGIPIGRLRFEAVRAAGKLRPALV